MGGGPGGGLLTPATVTVRIPIGGGKQKAHDSTTKPFDMTQAALNAGLAVVTTFVVRGLYNQIDGMKGEQSPYIHGQLDRVKNQIVWNIAVTGAGSVVTNKLLGKGWQDAAQAGIQAGAAEAGNFTAKFVAATRFDQTAPTAIANFAQQGFVNIRDNVTMAKHPFDTFTYNLGPVYVDMHPRAPKGARVQVQVDPLQAAGLAYHVGRNVIGEGGAFDLTSTLKTGTLVFQANTRTQKRMSDSAQAYFMPYFGNAVTLGNLKSWSSHIPYKELDVASFDIHQGDGKKHTWEINTPEQMVNFLNGPFRDDPIMTPAEKKMKAAEFSRIFNEAYGKFYDISRQSDYTELHNRVTEKQYRNMVVVHENTHAQNNREILRFTKPSSDKIDAELYEHGVPKFLTTRGSYAVVPYLTTLAADKAIGVNGVEENKVTERSAYAAEQLYAATNKLNKTYTGGEQQLLWDSSKGESVPQFVFLGANGNPQINPNMVYPNGRREGVPEIGAGLMQQGIVVDTGQIEPAVQRSLDSYKIKPSTPTIKRP